MKPRRGKNKTKKEEDRENKTPRITVLITSTDTDNWEEAQTEYKYMIKLTFRGMCRWMTLTDGQFGC